MRACSECDSFEGVLPVFGPNKSKPARYVCRACREKARRCGDCDGVSAVMFEVRPVDLFFAKIEADRIAAGQIFPRVLCSRCASSRRSEVMHESGRPLLVDDAPALEPAVSGGVFARASAPAVKTKPPRRSSAGGVFAKVKP